MATRLVIVNSNHKLSGTDFKFRYNFGDNLCNSNYDMCRLKFIDLNVETDDVNATTDGLNSMGMLYCSANLGQNTLCNNTHDGIFGYSKYHRGSANGYYHITQPNPIIMDIPVIKGIVEFSILDEDFNVLTGANVNGTTIIFQVEFFNKQELSEKVGDSFFTTH